MSRMHKMYEIYIKVFSYTRFHLRKDSSTATRILYNRKSTSFCGKHTYINDRYCNKIVVELLYKLLTLTAMSIDLITYF